MEPTTLNKYHESKVKELRLYLYLSTLAVGPEYDKVNRDLQITQEQTDQLAIELGLGTEGCPRCGRICHCP